jgi:hypothetical protein
MDGLEHLPEEQRLAFAEELKRLIEDFPYYARKALKVATKAGDLVPFAFNKAQEYVHERLEEQLFEHNQIRALVLKGRQQGMSTYTEGRFYWKTQLRRNKKAYILTHLAEATDNLFAMVERYHNNVPVWLRPQTDTNNTRQLRFPELDSGYKVGTAGSKGAGRSGTYHYFHGSEVTFWPNAEKHAAGVLQTVGRGNGTEVIFESTANGPTGYFYQLWAQSVKGIGDFVAIFVPWFWQEEYRQEPPDDWQPEGDESQRLRVYGLDRAQAYWMHNKNVELGGQPGVICNLFMQEYPCTAAEAFVSSGGDTVCAPADVAAARANDLSLDEMVGARVMGVDPARMGADRTSIIDRKGRKAYNLQSLRKKRTTEVAATVGLRINKAREEGDPYQAVFIDVGGVGGGVVDVLHEAGFGELIIPVNFGGRPLDPELYINKRSEMWKSMGLWLETEAGVDIPDDDSLHADLIGPSYTHNLVRNQFVLESKEQMVKRGIPSPDEGDSLALTFAFPVAMPAVKKKRRAAQDWRT